VTIYATLLGSPDRTTRNTDLESLLIWGLAQFRVVPLVQAGRTYASVQLPYGRAPLRLVAARAQNGSARIGRGLTEKVVASAAVSLPVKEGEVLGRVQVWDGKRLVVTRDLVASRTVNKPSAVRRLGWYAGRTLHHLAHLLS
jgi:serine-type D-Ala-D-Ala carboxypeptidase (penicillin-binding protein 5/6)